MGVPILSDREGQHITDKAKVEALNKQFVSVFTQDNGEDLLDKGPSPYSANGTSTSPSLVSRNFTSLSIPPRQLAPTKYQQRS